MKQVGLAILLFAFTVPSFAATAKVQVWTKQEDIPASYKEKKKGHVSPSAAPRDAAKAPVRYRIDYQINREILKDYQDMAPVPWGTRICAGSAEAELAENFFYLDVECADKVEDAPIQILYSIAGTIAKEIPNHLWPTNEERLWKEVTMIVDGGGANFVMDRINFHFGFGAKDQVSNGLSMNTFTSSCNYGACKPDYKAAYSASYVITPL